MTDPLIELTNLSAERDGRTLFSGLSYTVAPGDIVQVLGANGSGKTTLLRAITGISSDFEGEIFWRGEKMSRSRWDFQTHLLYIGHLPGIQGTLTAEENLRWYAGLNKSYQDENISDALKQVGLRGYEEAFCHQLSAGQLRRVSLARLYLTSAPLWVLDEPFTAIDTRGVDRLRERMKKHAGNGGAILLTTHQELGINNVQSLNLLDFQGPIT